MVQINWGLATGPGGFQNALAQGYEIGSAMRQRQEEKERKNALAAYATDPNEQNFAGLAQAAPEFAIREREAMQARQQEQQVAQLTQRAMSGDDEALGQLATVKFDVWKTLDARSKEQAANEAKIFGNAAIDILQTGDPAQRMAKLQGYAQQLGGQYPEVAQIAQLPPEQLEAALRGAVAEAQMVEKLIAMEQPRYQVIPEGGTLVNTRDPGAVSQFGQMQQAPAPRGAGGNDAITMEIYRGAVNGLGAQGAAAWLQRNNLPVTVTTPQEARQLPSGTRIILPDGSEGRVP